VLWICNNKNSDSLFSIFPFPEESITTIYLKKGGLHLVGRPVRNTARQHLTITVVLNVSFCDALAGKQPQLAIKHNNKYQLTAWFIVVYSCYSLLFIGFIWPASLWFLEIAEKLPMLVL